MNTIRFMSHLDRPWSPLLIVGCCLGLSPARAQTPPSSADAGAARPAGVANGTTAPAAPEEVQVTGQRKSETLQKAPVSVVVLGKSTLDAAGVKQASDFVALAPGVSLVANTAEVGDSQVNIRGINSARDAGSSFAYVVDGILLPDPASFNREYSDLGQIEILKGPQNAIYGRSAEAGAIVVTTVTPSDRPDAFSIVGGGGFNTIYNQSTVSGPIVKDRLFGRLSFDYRNTDGFDTNSFLHNSSVDDRRDYDVVGRLIYRPTDDWSFDLKARYALVDAAAINYNAVFELPSLTGFFGPAVNENVNAHQFDYVNNIQPENHQDTEEISIKADHDLGWGRLSAYGLYTRVDNDLLSDGTLAPFGFFNNADNVLHTNTCKSSQAAALAGGLVYPAPQNPALGFLGPYTASTCDGYQYQVRNEDDVSAEVRLSSVGHRPLRWSVGAYYLHTDRQVGVSVGDDLGLSINTNLYNPINSTSPTAQLYDDEFTTNVFAGFASLDYDILPNLTLATAFRYDVELRRDDNLVPTGNRQDYIDIVSGGAANGQFSPLNPGLIANPAGIPSKSVTFQQPEPKVSLDWSPVRNATLYASFGIGFKSGGFNSAGTQATVANIAAETGSDVKIGDQFGKETSDAYEIGIKGSFLQRRLSYQLDGYFTQVHGMQFSEFFSSDQGLLRVDSNIDLVDLQGAELGLQYRPLDWLSFSGGGALTGSEIKKNLSRPDTVGNKSPYTPAYTTDVAANVVEPLTRRLRLIGRIETNFTGSTWFHTVQRQSVPTINGVDADFSGSERQPFSTTNLRVGIAGPHSQLIFFVQNLFYHRYLAEVIPAPEFGGSFVSQGPGRLIGAELTLHL